MDFAVAVLLGFCSACLIGYLALWRKGMPEIINLTEPISVGFDVDKWTAAARPLLACMFVGTFCAIVGFIVVAAGPKLSAQDAKEILVFFAGMVSGLISYYFGQRGSEKANQQLVDGLKKN